VATDKNPDSVKLHELLAEDWERDLSEHPEMATRVGVPGHNHRWTDISLEAIERRKEQTHASLKRLKAIDRARLDEADGLHHDLYLQALEREIDGQRFPGEYLPVDQMSGVQQDVPQLLAMMPHGTVEECNDILSRLRGIPPMVDQTLVLLEEGLEAGVTPPRITLQEVPEQVEALMGDDSPLLRPLQGLPESLGADRRTNIEAEAREILDSEIRPALRRLHGYLVETYIPAAREAVGWSALPDGDDWYAHAVKVHTTTALTPREIHDLGQSEVQRIRQEMEKVIAGTGFAGSFAGFLEFLNSDPKFYFETGEKLVQGYRDIAKRADAGLIRLFGRLPRLPYGVEPVPDFAEKSMPTAYYQPGSLEAGRPGIFHANTYDLSTRPSWEMEALTLHEAVPGHHLQIALAQEMQDVPAFRRFAFFTAFIEGWGLYAESLGSEMGFYTDPYSLFGRLTYEMWRAIRLVVDTGMHALGWSRQQAIDTFGEHAGRTDHEVVVEVDRYIVWPGQALAYKVGELKFKELRARAETALGDRFDLRRFHDRILEEGALPLGILEGRLASWIEDRKQRS
jgi:uncharacterized protein (DUF885 family)